MLALIILISLCVIFICIGKKKKKTTILDSIQERVQIIKF